MGLRFFNSFRRGDGKPSAQQPDRVEWPYAGRKAMGQPFSGRTNCHCRVISSKKPSPQETQMKNPLRTCKYYDLEEAGMAELADALDLGSSALKACRFKSCSRHQYSSLIRNKKRNQQV